METSGCPAGVTGSYRSLQYQADQYLQLPDRGEIQRILERVQGDCVDWGAVRHLKAAAMYGLTEKYLNILTMHGHGSVAGLHISLSAPETPHKDVALKREDVKCNQVEQLGI